MSGNSFYDMLEISPDASAEVIRAAYRSLSRKYHPDTKPDAEGGKRFRLIQEAWETLSDADKRRRYDEQLERTGQSSGNGADNRQDSADAGTAQLPPDLTVMKVDGTSSFLTLSEHFKRKWKEAADCDLGGMKFDGVSFRGAVLNGAKLDGSSFVGCDFSNADLTDCSAHNCGFHGVRFSGADLVRTAFSRSDLQNTVFLQAHVLQGSTHEDVGVRFTSLDTTIHTVDSSVKTRPTLVTSVDFGECDLRGAEFCLPPIEDIETTNNQKVLVVGREVSLYLRQKFSFCQIHESSFAKSNLRELNLRDFDLKGCSFSGAHLQGVNLEGADIQGLDLATCNLVDANLHNVKYNECTRFPDGYPIPSDAVKVESSEDEDGARRQRAKAEPAVNGSVVAAVLFAICVVCVLAVCIAMAIIASK